MRFIAISLIAAFTGAAALAAENARGTAEHNVTVCMEAGSMASLFPSRELASKMFAGIGVKVHWRFGLSGCPPQAIHISWSTRTPSNLKPGLLAYALPYEGTHIVVFYDRIVQEHSQLLVKPLLAHVLVHEITHMLEGVNAHTPSGIMKARWTREDFDQMYRKSLDFTKDDIDRIYRGLAAR